MNGMVLQPILSLCSGAGGLDLGVHDALGGRARTVCYVEHETTACEVLATRIADGALDDAPIWTDLNAFDGRPWRGKVGGIIGGYPCQPFSVAGRRLGVNDPRHLWPSIARIIAECEPGWCFFENVAGHLRLGYWDVVRPDLERLGYRVAEGLFTAAEVGAPHQRERLFILAYREGRHVGNEAEWQRREDPRRRGSELAHRDTAGFGCERGGEVPGDGQLSEPGRGQEGRTGAGSAEPVLGDSEQQGMEGGVLRGGPGTEGRKEPDGSARKSSRLLADTDSRGRDKYLASDEGGPPQQSQGSGSFKLPVFPPGPGDTDAWQRILAEHPDLAPAVEPSVRLLADGLETRVDLSRGAQLRITGNGVVPQCASLAFRTLAGQLADAGHTERTGGADEG